MLFHKLAIWGFQFFKKNNEDSFADEYEEELFIYWMETKIINYCTLLIIYVTAFLVGSVKETLLLHIPYVCLRRYSYGWHAQKFHNCIAFSLTLLILLPKLLAANLIPLYYLLLVSAISCLLVWLYAPADTDHNPLTSENLRKQLKRKSMIIFFVITLIAYLSNSLLIQNMVIIGLFMQTLMISPFIYKITNRRYRNYEEFRTNEEKDY